MERNVRLAVAGVVGLSLLVLIGVIYGTGLDRVPPHLAHDEVVIEVNARSVAKSGVDVDGNRFPVFVGDSALGMPGGEPLTTYWTAFVIKTLWEDEFAIRRASVLIGLLNIGLMFLVARRYFGNALAGAFAAVLLAMTPVHFFYSRIGVEVVYLLPFFLGWFLLLTIDAEEASSEQRLWPIAASTFVLGLSVYAYKNALVLAPAYLALTIALVVWRAHESHAPVRRIGVMAAAAVAGFLLA